MHLEARNISYRYGKGPWLFQDLDFSLQSGEVVGLQGPSGYGKTTLAKIISGYEKPVTGEVLINNQPLQKHGYNPVQLVFQHPEKAVNPRWKMEKIVNEGWTVDESLLALLGIEKDWLQRYPNELSGGELQRFCVARALGPQTKFLIADEMTTMLDANTQAQIWHAVLEIAEWRQLGLLVISHDQPLLDRVCQRVINFTSGK